MPRDFDETPTEGMKRIEEAFSPTAGAGRSTYGYNAGIGARSGSFSGNLISAGDPTTGQPVMVGGRAQAGPLSYQYVQPTVRGVPGTHQVGIGGKPFDADAYFGITAQQGPGGRAYGANVGSGGFNAYGQYNPERRDLSIGAGYQTNFATGGRASVGHTQAAGVPVTIENRKGDTRHRQDSGDSKMAADYGYIDTSRPDHDGMKTDAFVGPHKDSDKVFVVNQQHPRTGKFNEHKVLLGYKDRAHALRDYVHSFSDGLGHKRIHSVVEMGVHELKDWLKKDHSKPLKKAEGGPILPSSDPMGSFTGVEGIDQEGREPGMYERMADRLAGAGVAVGEPIRQAAMGISDVPGSIGSYIAETSQKPDPSQRMAEDIRRFGGAFVDQAMSSPTEFAKTVGGLLPGIGEAISAYDAKHLYSDLQQAEAEGDTKKADTLRQLYGLAAAGAVPGAGVAARVAGKAKRGLMAAEDIAGGAERGLAGEAERAALKGPEDVAAAPTLYKPVEEAFQATPEPAEVRTTAVDYITESIDASDGAAAQLPTKQGLGPMYVVDSGVEPTEKGFLLSSTKNSNAERQLAGISPLLEEFPDMALDPDQWARGMAKAFGSKDVVAPPYRFMKAIENGEYTELLRGLTEGQIADADAGFRAGKEFLNAYHSGKMRVEDTGKLFMWGIMSRGVNPFTHEGLFLDAFQGIEPFIKMASEGKFTKEIAEGPYKEWAATTAPKGSGQPGAGAMHNLNAFGEDFLVKMGTPGKDGITPMQKLHNMMSDPQMTGRDIRREFAKVGEGVGIDNKVVSFILLATGRDDVMVIDRIQLKNVWDDGRYADMNIWDGISVPTVELANGTTKRFPPTEAGRAAQREFLAANEGATGGNAAVTGSSLAEATYGAKGILVYEALEDALMKNVGKMYADLGRPEAASPGRFHWETWVARSNQEASHGTLPAILAQAKGAENPLEGIYSKQGDYQTYAYGAKYFRGPDGPYFMMPRSDGSEARISVPEMVNLQEQLKDYTKGAIPAPTPSVMNPVTGEVREFSNTPAGRAEANAYAKELTEQARQDAAAANPSLDKKAISAIKVPVKDRGFAVTSAEGRPWHEDQTVNRERVDKLINDAEHRTESALRQSAQGPVPDVTGRAVADARAATGFDVGIPRTYGSVDRKVSGQLLKQNPPAFNAQVENVYQMRPEAASIYQKAKSSTPLVYELKPGDQSAEAFHASISRAKEGHPHSDAVYLYEPSEYKDMRLFLTPDGTAGFALKGDDIVSVFNNTKGPHKRVSNPLLDLAIAQGGRKLDAYDTVLPHIYGKSGFKTTSRQAFNPEYAPPTWNYETFKDFNKGKPDVVHMVYDPRHSEPYDLSHGKFFTDYEDAVAHQEKNVKTTNNYLEKSRKGYDKQIKAASEATSFVPGFAQGGSVRGYAEGGEVAPAPAFNLDQKVDATVQDVAGLAQDGDIDQRKLAFLLRKASTGTMPADVSYTFAGEIMDHDTPALIDRFGRYPRSIRILSRVDAALGGEAGQSLGPVANEGGGREGFAKGGKVARKPYTGDKQAFAQFSEFALQNYGPQVGRNMINRAGGDAAKLMFAMAQYTKNLVAQDPAHADHHRQQIQQLGQLAYANKIDPRAAFNRTPDTMETRKELQDILKSDHKMNPAFKAALERMDKLVGSQ